MRFEQRNFEQVGCAQILNKLAALELFRVQSSQEENFSAIFCITEVLLAELGAFESLGEHLKRVEKKQQIFPGENGRLSFQLQQEVSSNAIAM